MVLCLALNMWACNRIVRFAQVQKEIVDSVGWEEGHAEGLLFGYCGGRKRQLVLWGQRRTQCFEVVKQDERDASATSS